MFAVGAALRLAVFAALYFAALATGHPGHFDNLDPVTYDRWAWYVGDHLRHGTWVDIRWYNLAGTYDVGFQYFVGLQYAVFGHHTVVPRILNTLLAAFCAPLVYWGVRRTVVGEPAARIAGWLLALWPLNLYWSGYDLIKDPLAWFLVALVIYAITSPSRRQFVLLGAIGGVGLLLVRSYVGLGMFLFIPIAAAVRRDWRAFAGVVAVLVVAEAGLIAAGQPPVYSLGAFAGNGLPLHSAGAAQQPGGVAKIVGEATGDKSGQGLQKVEGGTNTLSLVHQPPRLIAERAVVGTVVTVLGPRPSIADLRHPTLDVLMYPGLLAWIALIPFTVLGFVRAARRRDPVELTLAALAIGLLLGLSYFYGGVFRQREMIWSSVLIFTGTGLQRPFPRRWWRFYAILVITGLVLLVAREVTVLLTK